MNIRNSNYTTFVCMYCKIVYVIPRRITDIDVISCVCGGYAMQTHNLHIGDASKYHNTKNNPAFNLIKRNYPGFIIIRQKNLHRLTFLEYCKLKGLLFWRRLKYGY
jgi:hypothetical protein